MSTPRTPDDTRIPRTPDDTRPRRMPTPSRRALLTGTAALAGWFAVMNAGAVIIAAIAGYQGRTGALFALSMSPGYGPAAAHGILTGLGAHGRVADAATLGVFDVAFPLLYGWVLSAALRRLAAGWRVSARTRIGVARFPLVAVAANWLADACILALIAAFPAALGPVAVAASVLTAVKLAVILISVAAVLAGGAAAAIARVRRAGARRVGRPA
jgi:hypothetical protein